MKAKAPRRFTGRVCQATGRDALRAAAGTLRAVWQAACEHDGIDVAAPFAVFSDANPFAPFVDRAVVMLREVQADYAAGGYVGLTIECAPPSHAVSPATKLRAQIAEPRRMLRAG